MIKFEISTFETQEIDMRNDVLSLFGLSPISLLLTTPYLGLPTNKVSWPLKIEISDHCY